MRLIDADKLIARLTEVEAKANEEKKGDLAAVCAATRIFIDGLPSEDRWYRRDEREPTEADCDSAKCLLAVHRFNGVMTTHIANFRQNSLYTHWRPAIGLPGDAEE